MGSLLSKKNKVFPQRTEWFSEAKLEIEEEDLLSPRQTRSFSSPSKPKIQKYKLLRDQIIENGLKYSSKRISNSDEDLHTRRKKKQTIEIIENQENQEISENIVNSLKVKEGEIEIEQKVVEIVVLKSSKSEEKTKTTPSNTTTTIIGSSDSLNSRTPTKDEDALFEKLLKRSNMILRNIDSLLTPRTRMDNQDLRREVLFLIKPKEQAYGTDFSYFLDPKIRRTVFSCKTEIKWEDEDGQKGVNQYIEGELIGEGMEGKVKICKNIFTEEIFAMKKINKARLRRERRKSMMRRNQEDPFVQVFKEFEILKQLNHPNTIRTYEIIECDDNFFIISEHLGGGQLTVLDESGNVVSPGFVFDEKVAKYYFLQLLRAIQCIHSQNIIHRDIKPANIIMTKDQRRIVLCDFGLATKFKDEDDFIQERKGTYYFYSPEATLDVSSIQGKKQDMWAAGVTLYALIFGHLPFRPKGEDESLPRLFQIIRSKQITLKKKKISSDLKDLFQRLLDKDPETRINADEAIDHPWFENVDMEISSQDLTHYKD